MAKRRVRILVTVPPVQPRHSLLPDRERSRAVFVGSDAGLRQQPYGLRPQEATAGLSQILTAPGPGGALHRDSTTLVLGPRRPADVLDALRQAAEAATDVLLFSYAGSTSFHEGELFFDVTGTDPSRPETGVDPEALARIMHTSRAARPVVILDCDHAPLVASRFTETAPDLSLMAAAASSFWPMADPFTETLVTGLTSGVHDGPQALDLATLKDAIEAGYTRMRYYVENEYIGAPSHVLVRGGRELALGINPSFGRKRSGALPPHPDVVEEQEAY